MRITRRGFELTINRTPPRSETVVLVRCHNCLREVRMAPPDAADRGDIKEPRRTYRLIDANGLIPNEAINLLCPVCVEKPDVKENRK